MSIFPTSVWGRLEDLPFSIGIEYTGLIMPRMGEAEMVMDWQIVFYAETTWRQTAKSSDVFLRASVV